MLPGLALLRVDSRKKRCDRMAESELGQQKSHIRTITWEKLTWLDIEQPTQLDVEYLKQNYHFDDLELEDCLRRVHRAKIDGHEGYVFVMSHFPVFHRQARVTLPSQVSFFLSEDYLITLHEGNLEPLRNLFKNCQLDQATCSEYMGRGSAHLLYHIFDLLVSYCFPILNHIGSNVEKVEEQVFGHAVKETVRDISVLRRDIISFRRIMKSQTEVFELLEQGDYPVLKEKPEVHFGDLAGHCQKIRDELDDYKEVVEGLNDTHNTLTSFQTNTVVRALTIISTIMLPLTLIASIFGMHLEHLPLGQSPTAFLTVMLIMVAIIIFMLTLFRLRRWL
jgi:magnesium transporter